MFLVEIGKAFRRLRTYVLGTGLLLIAVLPTIVLAATGHSGSGGPPFLNDVRSNGLYGALAALAVAQPFFLALGTSLLAGETIAAEAAGGTLRYVLIRPVGRARLVLQKYASVVALLLMAVVWVAVAGLLAGWIAFGIGPMATLSGTTLAVGPALLRILAATAYVLIELGGLAAVGVFFSTLTDSSIGAAGIAFSIAILSQILDGITLLHAIHPYLPTHDWLAFSDLFRSPVLWTGIVHGLEVTAAYSAIFLGAALARFERKDVTS
jgi:ABC-2 type transport system permease protein